MMNSRRFFISMAVFTVLLTGSSCKSRKSCFYSAEDFVKVPKTDVHFHYNTRESGFLLFADSIHFRLVSPNVDAGTPIDTQLAIASFIRMKYPDKFAFLGTFPVEGSEKPGFGDSTISQIKRSIQAGASGIKIWKNIGMVLKDSTGKFVMVSNQLFDPIFNYLESNKIPVMGHLGEPRNCWLPENEMTVDNDRRYFSEHPQYYMYLHPEAPSYNDQINARDRLLEKHPQLDFTGAHLASLEWNVDELAKRFDRFPLLKADISARIGQLQFQSLSDGEKVRNFFIRYQDRLMYGSDMGVSNLDTAYFKTTRGIYSRWRDHWIYLATDSVLSVRDLGGRKVKGLRLPCGVIDKIYNKNAGLFFQSFRL